MGYGIPKGAAMSKYEKDMTAEESSYAYYIRKSYSEEKAKEIIDNYFLKLRNPNAFGRDFLGVKACLKILGRKHL